MLASACGPGSIRAEDLSIFRKLMEVNYMGALNCIHPALAHLKERKGMIVAITSIQGKVGVPLHTGYVASKHALQGFCDALRLEVADSGVEILTVLPHWLRGTELRQHAFGPDGQPLGESSRKHGSQAIALDVAARAIIEAVRERRRELYLPWKLKLLAAIDVLFPRLSRRIIGGTVSKEDRG